MKVIRKLFYSLKNSETFAFFPLHLENIEREFQLKVIQTMAKKYKAVEKIRKS